MNDFLFTLIAFIAALAVLITVHEFGHFWVARRCGVKVLRFSIGFGQPLWRRRFGADDTELVIAALPFGGYVKMLDEREGEVPAEERHRSFNRASLGRRAAIVAAGPLFNLGFAILAYWVMYLHGVEGSRPLLGEIEPSSYAAAIGLREGDEIRAVNGEPTLTWNQAIERVLGEAVADQRLRLRIARDGGELVLEADPPADLLGGENPISVLGFNRWQPTLAPVIGGVVEGSPAAQAGLRSGDELLSADGQAVGDWAAWVDLVRAHPERELRLQVRRDGEVLSLSLRPERVELDGVAIGRIGAYAEVPAAQIAAQRVTLRYGPLEALARGWAQTWDMAALTLRAVGKMIIGEASTKNLSGPVSIAQFAGQSASIGLATFLNFLAVVSISLGLLNLLPIPILDGGHLMFYLVEWLRGGRPVSERTEMLGQRIGIAVLAGVMGLALFNDFSRLFQ